MADFPRFAILKEELASEELPAIREAGLVGGPALEFLESYRKHYTPHQGRHHETGEPAYWYYNSETYVDTVRKEVGKTLEKAVASGNTSIIDRFIGLVDSGGPTMDFVDYERLCTLIEEPSLLLLLFGDTGSGKTFTAARLAELWEFRTGGKLLTNVESMSEANDRVAGVESYVDILTYCIEHPDERKLLLADELSSLMSGYSGDSTAVETYMRPLVRKMRKKPFRMSIIGIGHRPGDIHPTMRNGELSYFGFKGSDSDGETKKQKQKHLTIYEDLAGETGVNPLVDVRGIGLPDLKLDTNDSGNWAWGEEEEILEAAYSLRDAGYGDMLQLIRQLEPKVEDAKEAARTPPQCAQIKDNGEQCGAKVWDFHESGLCDNHR